MSITICFLNGNSKNIEDYYFEKEYRDDVIVELNEMFYELYFFTQDSLEYEITKDGYFAFPGLIILDEISIEKIKISIKELYRKGYFEKLKGNKKMSQEDRFIHDWYVNELELFDSNKVYKEELE